MEPAVREGAWHTTNSITDKVAIPCQYVIPPHHCSDNYHKYTALIVKLFWNYHLKVG